MLYYPHITLHSIEIELICFVVQGFQGIPGHPGITGERGLSGPVGPTVSPEGQTATLSMSAFLFDYYNYSFSLTGFARR